MIINQRVKVKSQKLKFKIQKAGFFFLLLLNSPVYSQSADDLYLERNFNKDKIVAVIDSLKITAEEFYLNYEYGPAFIKKKKDSKEKHLDYMINEKLLALDGYSRRVDTTDELSSVITEFRNDLATEELFKDKILSQVKISEAEIDEVINQKLTELELKWIYSADKEGVEKILNDLQMGNSFDSLFSMKINDSVFIDERSLKTTRYQLEVKNPLLAKIVDSLRAGDISKPVHVNGEWYIIKIVNVINNIITTESEYRRLHQESVNAVTKRRMDSLSDQYVHELMLKNNPVIKREAFNLIRSYLGKYYLPEEKYEEWQLEQKLNLMLKNIDDDANSIALVSLNNREITVKEFLSWYRNRSSYAKLNKADLKNFSTSLEQLIWRMVRDKLLSEIAAEHGYDKLAEVNKQILWWKDKIVSSFVRNEIANAALLETDEIKNYDGDEDRSDHETINYEFQKKLLHKILALKKKYNIRINEDELAEVPVSVENEPGAIEFYAVKKGGLIPRTPYPTINHEWVNWE